ncbi:hypothetical protein [Roseivivax sp. THAF197b]|uniref:hypothetical protein n=1 Tax=Roseivivax sp. THAF197b TaxID=2588299 RepID=UPI001268ACF6|nr:hypothetical protein [Roseivivax sp. THAF197b]QFS84810.1 hypothetical protein FIV09_18365 [Roseivivax sp. THAF197b]
MATKKKIPPDPLIQLADAVLANGKKTLEEIRAAMIETLRPESAFEMRRAQEIAGLEVELEQHQRMHDAYLVAKAQELAAGLFAQGVFKIIARDTHPDAHAKARALFAEDAETRDAALDALWKLGVTQVELLARAHQALAEPLAQHQNRISGLMKRRRELFDDYETLRVSAARSTRHG